MPLKHTVTEVKLKNGAQGLVIDVPDGTVVSYSIGFRAGLEYARTPEIREVSHIMEHLAFGASDEFPNHEIFSQEFTKNGAYHNAHTGVVTLWYDANAPLMEWDRILELERDAITHFHYTNEALLAEKRNIKEETLGRINNNALILWEANMKAAGLTQWDDIEDIKTIEPVTLEDVLEHYHRTHTTRNMQFIVAGDLSAHHRAIKDLFETWQMPQGKKLSVKQETAHRPDLVHIFRAEVNNLYFGVYFFLNRILSYKEQVAMSLLNHILTGTFHSRIFGTARTKGLAYYGVDSYVRADPSGMTVWGLRSQVSLGNAASFFKLIIHQLQEIARGNLTPQELLAAKEYKLGSLQMSAQTVAGLVDWYRSPYFDRQEITYAFDTPSLIKGVSNKQIQTLAQEFLSSGIWSFGGLGNISKSELFEHYQLFTNFLDREV